MYTGYVRDYGSSLVLKFQFQERTLYALYAHLTCALVHPGKHGGTQVNEGDEVALTGTSGNAAGGPPHLHFEVWTKPDVWTKGKVGKFPDGRISPGEILGYFYDNMDNRMPYLNMG